MNWFLSGLFPLDLGVFFFFFALVSLIPSPTAGEEPFTRPRRHASVSETSKKR